LGNIDLACGQNWIGGNNPGGFSAQEHLTKSFLWVTFIEVTAFSFLTQKKKAFG